MSVDAEDIQLTGPPEPVRDGNGVEIVIPTGEPVSTGTPFERVQVGTWRCKKCETVTPEGAYHSNGSLTKPQTCDGCDCQGPFAHVGGIDPSALDFALQDRVYAPSGVDDSRFEEIWDDVEQYLRDHWDAKEDEVYAGLTAFAISTWFRPNMDFVPHLMLMGHTVSGKTRLLNTLARVSYRGIVAVDPSPASMYRMVDKFDMSFYISEYHGLPYEKRQLIDSVIRAGQKRGELIPRAGGGDQSPDDLNLFDPFTHAAVATQKDVPDDIVNRCIQVHSSRAERDMPATHDEAAAEDIRNRLLYARLRLLDSDEWDDYEEAAYDWMAERDIKDRSREKLLGLLIPAIRWARLDGTFGKFADMVCRQDKEAAAESEDAEVIRIIRDKAHEAVASQQFIGTSDPYGSIEIAYGDIVSRYEDVNDVERNNTWLGNVRSRLGLEAKRKSDGYVIADRELGPKLRKLCKDHNLEWEPDGEHGDGSPGEIDDPRHTVRQHIDGRYDSGDELTAAAVAGELADADISPDQAGHILTRMAQQGDLERDGNTFTVP